MEIGSNLIASLRDRLGSGRSAVAADQFDWSGLHARLAAAHAAGRVLRMQGGASVLLSGSFEDWPRVAGRSGEHASPGINPMSSADGKIPAGIDFGSAGQSNAGGRG